MTSASQQNTIDIGFSLMEAPQPELEQAPRMAGQVNEGAGAERRLQELERDIEQLQLELAEIERRARAAIEAEDTASLASYWNGKRRLLETLTQRQQQRAEAERQIQNALDETWVRLQADQAAAERLRHQSDRALSELLTAAESMQNAVRQVVEVQAELSQQQQVWEAHLEELARRGAIVPGSDGRGAATKALRSRTPRANRSGRAPIRKWAVYDPDAGKLVETLPELLRLLVRWYPTLRTDDERVREFLTLPNADPLPERLRTELREAGFAPADRGLA